MSWLIVNGDSHTAGAEAVNRCAFAEDDSQYAHLKRKPHPDNLEVSWGHQLSKLLNYQFHCLAESASSNTRILRTTRQFIKDSVPTIASSQLLIIIGWSTWEREEWLINDEYYQVNARGIDDVPEEWRERYTNYILDVDWYKVTKEMHEKIWDFHCELEDQNIKHVFFNGNNTFESIDDKKDWGTSYYTPYYHDGTFHDMLEQNDHTTIGGGWHFGPKAHEEWAEFLQQYLLDNNIVQ